MAEEISEAELFVEIDHGEINELRLENACTGISKTPNFGLQCCLTRAF